MIHVNPFWLRVAYLYAGLAVLGIIVAITLSDSWFAGALYTTMWLSGIAVFLVMLRWWIRFPLQSKQRTEAAIVAISTPVTQELSQPQTEPEQRVNATVESGPVEHVMTEPVVEIPVEAASVAEVERIAPDVPTETSAESSLVFMSHATEDRESMLVLAAEIESHGIRTWLAFRDVEVGDNYAEEIVKAIVAADYLLVVLSEAAIESPHIRREVTIAIDRGIPLLPVNMSASEDFMWSLPVDWTYWLSLAQVMRHTDEVSTASELARRISR